MSLAKKYHRRFDSKAVPGDFKIFDKRSRQPDWNAKATPTIARVAEVWKSAGLNFPVAEVMEGW